MGGEGGPRSGFAPVRGARLHYLEWRGGGEPLVLLPGMGQSAHVFRDLAPALADAFHVVALTPRAHGESDAPDDGYTVASFAADFEAFLDALGLDTIAVAAHSFAGTWATRFAAEHPGRVSRIVYLDALTDYAGMGRVLARNPVRPPPAPDGKGPHAEREWLERYHYGFWSSALEADFAARPAAAEAARRRELLSHLMDDAIRHPSWYAGLRCPALALVALESVATHFAWLDAADHERRSRAHDYLETVRAPWRRSAAERLLQEAPHARVVAVPGHHLLFVSSQGEVVREMRAFLLPPD